MTLEESKQLNLGLEYSFVDKNKNIKKFLAANFESIEMSKKIIFGHWSLEKDHSKSSES